MLIGLISDAIWRTEMHANAGREVLRFQVVDAVDLGHEHHRSGRIVACHHIGCF